VTRIVPGPAVATGPAPDAGAAAVLHALSRRTHCPVAVVGETTARPARPVCTPRLLRQGVGSGHARW
jgi:hypothetical protein